MPNLTINNTTASQMTFDDGQGLLINVPATGSSTTKVTDQQLSNMEKELNAQQTAGKVTWSSLADDTDPAEEAGSVRSFQSALRVATGALETIPHTLGVVPTQVTFSMMGSPATYTQLVVTEGTHTATNLLVTMTAGWSYKIRGIVI